MEPISLKERIEVIDIIRGFAVFGILIVNMAYFNSPVYLIVTDIQMWTGVLDRVASITIRFLAEGKFISIFSLLFGMGMAILMMRADQKGFKFVPIYTRRLLILFLIGLVHSIFLWAGDILVPYAIFGFLLLLFRNCKQRTLIVWAIIFLVTPVLLMGLGWAFLEIGRSVPEAAKQIDKAFAEMDIKYRMLFEQSLRVYSEGSFADIMKMRLKDLVFMYFGLTFYGLNVIGMFLIGLYVARSGILTAISENLKLLRRVFWFGLIFGIIGNIIYVYARENANLLVPSSSTFLYTVGFLIGAPTLSLFYITVIVLLIQFDRWKKLLKVFSAVGKTSISNYLFQSLICTIIFYNYGFGFYGKVGPALGIVLTLMIITLQIVISNWWIKHFNFGPIEWLWRSATYGKVQPMRV